MKPPLELTYEKVGHTPQELGYRSVGDPGFPPVDDTWPKLGEHAREHGLYLIERTTDWRQLTIFLHPVTGHPQFTYEGPFLYPTDRDTQKRKFVYERTCLAVDLPPEQWPDLKWWAKTRWGTFYTAVPDPLLIAGYTP